LEFQLVDKAALEAHTHFQRCIMNQFRAITWFCLMGALLFNVATVHGVTVVEHFNNYGDMETNVNGLGTAGSGWADGWSDGTTRANYIPDTRLIYNDPNYNNSPNLAGEQHGVAGHDGGAVIASGQRTSRFLSEPMTGTVWASVLAYTPPHSPVDGVGGPDVLLWFNYESSQRNFIALRDYPTNRLSAVARINTGTTAATQVETVTPGVFTYDTTHLLLARLDLDFDGFGTGRINLWVDPDLSGGEAGLGAPTVVTPDVANAFDGGITNIGVSFAYHGSLLDSIRVSNDANGFEMVTALPGIAVPGDFNLDGIVDGADFLDWQRGDSPNPFSTSDLNDWEANFGAGTPFGAVTAVPEPQGLALIAFALVLAAGRIRRGAG